jgi:O-antigen/teichoic acid export membrane protein
MSNLGRTIAKNAIFLMASQVATWGLTLLLTVFLPRYLGAGAVGKFHLANSLWAIVGIVAAFGMDLLLNKEIARAPNRTPELLNASIVLRIILFCLGYAGIVGYANMVGYPEETRLVIYIIGIGNLFAQIMGAFESSLKGLERMDYVSLGNVIGKGVLTVLSIALLLMGQGVLVIAFVGIVAALVHLSVLFIILRRLTVLKFRIDWKMVGWMMKAGFPYLVIYVFLILYQQVDIVILSLLLNEESIGWYGTADQLFGTFLFVPTVFMTAVFPTLSRVFSNDPQSFVKLIRKSFELMTLLSVPIGLGVMVIANSLVLLLYGPGFANSGPILAVMGIVLILTYQNTLLGYFLISMDKQAIWTWVMFAAMVASIPLDLVLVPWCQATFGNGAIGGALAFVVTELGMLIAGLYLIPRDILSWKNIWLAVRALLAGLLMVAAIWWLRDTFILLPVIVGGIVYTSLVLLMRLVSHEDQELFKSLGLSVLNRIRGRASSSLGMISKD